MSFRKFLLFLALLAMSAQGQANVFGKDDRIMLDQDAFDQKPISMIVRIGNCTGALVGKNLVLTAYHCIDKRYVDGELKRRITVRAGAFETKNRGKARVTKVITGEESGTPQDWAVLVINKNFGEKFGYFSVKEDVVENYSDINLAGYSGDLNNRILSLHKNCNIRLLEGYFFLHDCDSSGGASGAPLWRKTSNGKYEIVGVHYGGKRLPGNSRRRLKTDKYSDAEANVASLPVNFIDAIKELR